MGTDSRGRDRLFLGMDTSSGWRLDVEWRNDGWPLGSHTYLAQAEDNEGRLSDAATDIGLVASVPRISPCRAIPSRSRMRTGFRDRHGDRRRSRGRDVHGLAANSSDIAAATSTAATAEPVHLHVYGTSHGVQITELST